MDEDNRVPMVYPSDGAAWKHFDEKHQEEASEARNVRIAIATDGFNLYGMSAASYSCWPVFVIPLNLPPGVLMQRKTIFLSLIILGPEYPGKNLSVLMQPLVDDLHHIDIRPSNKEKLRHESLVPLFDARPTRIRPILWALYSW